MSKNHYCYLLESEHTGRSYVGYTTDPHRRLEEHNGKGKKGAKHTRTGRPWHLICYIKGFANGRHARQFEASVKHCKKANPDIKEKMMTLTKNHPNRIIRNRFALLLTVLTRERFNKRAVLTAGRTYRITWMVDYFHGCKKFVPNSRHFRPYRK